MTVARTTLLDLPIITTGTESGLWGDYTNNGLTQYLDIAIAGITSLTSANFTSGALTIETTEGTNSATNIVATSAQYATIRVSSLAQASTITVGNTGTNPGRSYRLINDDSTHTLTFKATGQTGITLQPGQSAVVAFNGTDYALVGTIGPTVPVARGGTGATTLTLNNVILGNGTSAVQFVAPGTTGNVLTSNGTTWSSTAPAAGGITYVTKTSNYTTQNNEGVLANTAGGAFTVTLPATPATGAQVIVADPTGNWGTNNLTIGRNGSTIAGVAQDLLCNINGVSVQLVYSGTTWTVYAQVGGNTGLVAVSSGGTGATTLTANNVILGNGTSAVQFVAPGSSGNVLTSNGTTWTSAALSAGFTLGTPVATTSGTSIDFTGIPSGVKQIIVNFKGVSTNGGSLILIQLGDSGGVETTGYSSMTIKLLAASTPDDATSTAGFINKSNEISATNAISGSIYLTLENATSYTWVATGMLFDINYTRGAVTGGNKSLSAVLDRVRITTVNGTDTFNAGEINIAYI